ncbi:class C beta-lactamase [Pseudomonas sp. CCC3.2]|uniref:class C beta-lactamase n=1 Tax=Pseudomonas sp. AB6 TaxID=3048598 RepID=UPI002AB3A7ED|nr:MULTISPECIES: class C beta-lactamase [unclassified Pseudomonas]MDY7558960.1 class C beta-lactamase [Pseudomonas sp. AB6]MEB0182355.1 class C beta-lactamase [Pseudomonas sp. CCC3.2]MEB0209027.1 class C beta-lactamase [Pseudomonas sp. AB6]
MANAEPRNIDAVVQDAAHSVMSHYNVAGLAIAITVDGKPRFYNYGVASRETQQPVNNGTLFEIGSVSKTFTATLATYAQASGKLLLTDRPSAYVPELKGSPFDNVTLINLATHTAGGFPLQFPDDIRNATQMMAYFKAWQPTFAPGTYRTYANPSVGMLGMTAAKSMGMPFDQALEHRLFPELGMPNSFITLPANKLAAYAQGYDKNDKPVRLSLGVLGAEAYGVKTTSKDLIRFVEANMGLTDTSPLLKRAMADTHTGYFQLRAMTQDLIWEQYRYPVSLDALLEGNSNKMAYESNAVTALNPPLPPQQSVWINKTGSTNGFGAYVAFVPAKKLGIVMLANKNFPNEARVRLAYRILTELQP